MRFRHALVIGKFYPPHLGHHHLIDTAAAQCDRVTVVVAASTFETIPLASRVAWLRAVHTQPQVEIAAAVDDHAIDYDSPAAWDAHVEVFRNAVQSSVPIDAVFSSEPYGAELARRFEATHVSVDPGRTRFPFSGSGVRADPVACWDWLAPPVRAGLARRVIVVGAESSGTTTLARSLAARLAERGGVWASTRWVPEYGRIFCEEKLARARRDTGRPDLWIDDLNWEPAEFTTIAERHLELENACAAAGSPVLVCDTDAFATSLWHERYLGTLSPEVEHLHERAPHHLWLLTDIDGVDFEQDGWRDGEHIRARMHQRFRDELDRRALPHHLVSGTPGDRLDQAEAAVDALVDAGWHFGEPLRPGLA